MVRFLDLLSSFLTIKAPKVRKGSWTLGQGKDGFYTNGIDSDTLMAARSQPNDNWGSVGNGAKHGEKHVGGSSGMS